MNGRILIFPPGTYSFECEGREELSMAIIPRTSVGNEFDFYRYFTLATLGSSGADCRPVGIDDLREAVSSKVRGMRWRKMSPEEAAKKADEYTARYERAVSR